MNLRLGYMGDPLLETKGDLGRPIPIPCSANKSKEDKFPTPRAPNRIQTLGDWADEESGDPGVKAEGSRREIN